MPSIQQIEQEVLPAGRELDVRPGDRVRVHVRIQEDAGQTSKGKSRIQVFEGTVIALKNSGPRRTFTVRKISYGVGVERIFPVDSPVVERIEIKKRYRVRRAKLYYLRSRRGRAARLREIR